MPIFKEDNIDQKDLVLSEEKKLHIFVTHVFLC